MASTWITVVDAVVGVEGPAEPVLGDLYGDVPRPGPSEFGIAVARWESGSRGARHGEGPESGRDVVCTLDPVLRL